MVGWIMSVGSTLRAPETVLRDRRGHVIDLRPIAPRTAEELLTAYNKAGTGPTRRAEEVGLGTEKYRFWHPLPERYVFLAMRAYRNEELSIGRLAEMLCDADGRRRSIEAAQEFVASYPGGLGWRCRRGRI